MVQFKMNVLLI